MKTIIHIGDDSYDEAYCKAEERKEFIISISRYVNVMKILNGYTYEEMFNLCDKCVDIATTKKVFQ